MPAEILQGTLDMLIFEGGRAGAVARIWSAAAHSTNLPRPAATPAGIVVPGPHRLQRRGFFKSKWAESVAALKVQGTPETDI